MSKKTVLVTGGSSGIGLGIAEAFAKAGGYNIVINGLEKNGDEIAANLAKETSSEVMFHGANMLEREQINDLFDKTEAKFGPVSILVNSAGIQFVSPIDEFPVERWNLILGVNLTSAFHTVQRAWPNMKAAKWGRIINISSAHGLVASEFKSAYIASKHGIVGFTKCIALEGAPLGITANSICPGYVWTPLVEGQIKQQAESHGISEEEVVNKVMLYKHAIKKFSTVEQLGALALFLASDAGETMTGQPLAMDGGWTIQ